MVQDSNKKMKLKTLKDIENKICACGSHKESHKPHYTDDNDLKQEALKWVKGRTIDWTTTEWIKYFFNITEDDLK